MPIALSLMFPFAEAAGITLTGLGIAKATDVVMNYIQANPEKSKQILSTLSPLLGAMGSILTNKESGEDTSSEEQSTEEKDTRSKKEIVLDAVRKEKGNFSSDEAEGGYASTRGRVLKGLKDSGKWSGKSNPNYDPNKPKFNWQKYTKKADGGRIGYAPGGLATTQDYANALQRVGAGTAEQKRTSVNNYAQNEAYGLLNNAMSSQSGLTDLYNNYIKGQGGLSSNAFGFGRDAATSQTASTFDPKYKQQVLDQIAYKIQQSANNNITYKPLQKTYRSLSPEAQALNMDQSTYENIISMGADPKQYYMDFQNRMSKEAGMPETEYFKYGQVMGGGPASTVGMDIYNKGVTGYAPTQAQMDAQIQNMQNNPRGLQNFDDVVKYYGSNDPYMGQKQEIKDMVNGVDTGYMSGQDYYDQRVLGLDGQGIAEKYGLQYGTGGRVGYNQGGLVTMFVEKR